MVRELLAVLVRAVLQWALSSLLLANGAAFCLIAAVASSLRLGPPCLLCAHVHRLLLSSSSSDAGCSQEQDAFRRLLCDAHVAAIARPEPEKRTCSPSDHHVDRGTKHDSGLEAHRRVVSIGSEICEQDCGGDNEHPRATDVSNLESGNGEGPYVSMFELAPIVALPEPEDNQDYAKAGLDETPELTVRDLVAALRRELGAVRAELESERRAKAEAAERRRQLEEQGELDREAVRIAMQLVHETETEKHGLQRHLDAYRVKAQLHEAAVDTDLAPFNRLGIRQSRDGGGDLIEQEDCNGNNYQSLVDFLPGSMYSSSPDLANLLKLYTEGNGARRPRDGDITEASAVAAAAVITEEEEEEEEEEEVVVVTAASGISGFHGGNGEATSSAAAGAASFHESGSSHVQAASS
uniref:Uncharacterized protein n=1 Tax=Avena sativa TaxID=4498 RepID=A0ACD5Y0Q4_AVESA